MKPQTAAALLQRQDFKTIFRTMTQGRFPPPQFEKLLVKAVGGGVWLVFALGPDQAAGFIRLRVLRVGDLLAGLRIGESGKLAELLSPALAHQPAQFGMMVREVLKRCAGRPLLAHEE